MVDGELRAKVAPDFGDLIRWGGAAIAAMAILAAASWLAPWVQAPSAVAYCIGFLVLSAEMLAVAWLAPRSLAWSWAPAALAIAALFIIDTVGESGLVFAMAATAALLLAGSLVGAAVGACNIPDIYFL